MDRLPGGKIVTSRENPVFRGLRKLAHSRSERSGTGRILLEGSRLIGIYRSAVGEPEMMVLRKPAGGGTPEAVLPGGAFAGRTLLLTGALFREITALAGPNAILAVAEKPACVAPSGGDGIFLEGIQDPGNVGTIVRTAAAAGFGCVALSRSCADPWSPKSLRAGMGGQFHVGVEESADLLGKVGEFPGTVVALVPEGGESLFEIDTGERVAFLLGSEGRGLSETLRSAADRRATIPMPGWSESLNAASAAAAAIFEALRRRLETKKVIDKRIQEG